MVRACGEARTIRVCRQAVAKVGIRVITLSLNPP